MNVSEFKSRLNSKIQNSISKVQDFNALLYEAGSAVLAEIDPRSTRRVSQITNALYDKVYDYIAPADLKSNRIEAVYPQVNNSPSQKINATNAKDFDSFKSIDSGSFTIDDNSGVRTIRIDATSLPSGLTFDECNSLTNGGTWSVTGDASTISLDTLQYVSGNSSIKFNLNTSGSSGGITKTYTTPLDLSSFVNSGAFFVNVFIPDTTAITSVNIRFGSDSSNYYTQTVSSTQNNTTFVTGWNLLRFDWVGTAQVGTPINSAIDYLRIVLNYNGTAVPDCRVDSILVKNGNIWNIAYFSKFLYRNTSGVWFERPTAVDDSDIINLDIDEIPLLLAEVSERAAQEISGEDSSFNVEYWLSNKRNAWRAYKLKNKTPVSKSRTSYYKNYTHRYR